MCCVAQAARLKRAQAFELERLTLKAAEERKEKGEDCCAVRA